MRIVEISYLRYLYRQLMAVIHYVESSLSRIPVAFSDSAGAIVRDSGT